MIGSLSARFPLVSIFGVVCLVHCAGAYRRQHFGAQPSAFASDVNFEAIAHSDIRNGSAREKRVYQAASDQVKKIGRYKAAPLSPASDFREQTVVGHTGAIMSDWPGFTFALELEGNDLCHSTNELVADFDEAHGHWFGVGVYKSHSDVRAPSAEDELEKRRTKFKVASSTKVNLGRLAVGEQMQVTRLTERYYKWGSNAVILVSISLPKECSLRILGSADRLLEIVGDSDSNGFGTHGCVLGNETVEQIPHISQSDYNQHWEKGDIREAWSFRTGKLLSAETYVEAVSGSGIYSCPDPHMECPSGAMPARFERLLPMEEHPWDFKRFIPQAVIVFLGLNDYVANGLNSWLTEPTTFHDEWVTAYKAFVLGLHTKYKDAHVFLVVGGSGMWVTDHWYELERSDLANLVDSLSAQDPWAGSHLHVVDVLRDTLPKFHSDPDKYCGCLEHWSPAAHAVVAAKISREVRRVMGW